LAHLDALERSFKRLSSDVMNQLLIPTPFSGRKSVTALRELLYLSPVALPPDVVAQFLNVCDKARKLRSYRSLTRRWILGDVAPAQALVVDLAAAETAVATAITSRRRQLAGERRRLLAISQRWERPPVLSSKTGSDQDNARRPRMTTDRHERDFLQAGDQIVATLKEMQRVIAPSSASFHPHVVIAQQTADRVERIKAYRDAGWSDPALRDRMERLERNLRDQIKVYMSSFAARFPRSEAGSGSSRRRRSSSPSRGPSLSSAPRLWWSRPTTSNRT
jgi:hypothetical protein